MQLQIAIIRAIQLQLFFLYIYFQSTHSRDVLTASEVISVVVIIEVHQTSTICCQNKKKSTFSTRFFLLVFFHLDK